MKRRDQKPNIEMARELANKDDVAAISELLALAGHSTAPRRHDAIKVLFEAGKIKPALLAPHANDLLGLLSTRDNRIIWGSLQALDAITQTVPETIAAGLNTILEATDRSSVIARDKTMSILAKLNGNKRFTAIVTPVLLQRLTHSVANQFPMYAELAATTISEKHRADLINIIAARRAMVSSPAKQKRLDRLLRTLARSEG